MSGNPPPKKKPRRVKGCYNCSQRRINCDRGEPCQKCIKKGLQCSGLGIRYRFNDGVASRGRLAGKPVPVKDAGGDIAASPDSGGPGYGSYGSNIPDTPRHHLSALDHVDSQSRFLLNYFSTRVAPAMGPFNLIFNGYRDLILPMTEQDETVRNAIMATSASHLSLHHKEWSAAACKYRMAAIHGLNRRTTPSSAHPSLATMVILLIEEMIAVRTDFPILLRMIRSFVEMQGGPETLETTKPTSLGRFLMQQIRKISLYAGPFTTAAMNIPRGTKPKAHIDNENNSIKEDIDNAIDRCNSSKPDLDFLLTYLDIHPELSPSILKLASIIQNAAQIYQTRAANLPREANARLVRQFLAATAAFNASSPGGHILIWPFFIAGAECEEVADREFVTMQLRRLWETTGFGNTLYAIRLLEVIWNGKGRDGEEGNWARALKGLAEGFIM